MTTFDAAVIGAEAAARRVTLVGDLPARAQWAEIVKELDAIPTGARWWLEKYGKPIVLVMGEVSRIAGLEHIPPGANGFTADQGCVVSVPNAYKVTPTGVASNGTILHEVWHQIDRLCNGAEGRVGSVSLCDQGPFRSVGPLFASAAGPSRSEQFAEGGRLWCASTKGGFAWQPCPPAAGIYYANLARQAGWVQTGQLYWPR